MTTTMQPAPADAEPQIWTKYGLIPMSQLERFSYREDVVDQVEHHIGWKLKDTGEIVQNDKHVHPLAPWQTGKGGRIEQMALTGEVSSIT